MTSDDYKNAQRRFFNWVTKWTQIGVIEDSPMPDVPDIITLLQAIGYKVRYFTPCVNPEDVTPVAGGGGIRMLITCTHSGLRACLESTSECKCPEMNNSSFWEITGSAPNTSQEVIRETGSDILLPIGKGTQYVISQVINHLFNLIKTDQNQNNTRTPNKYHEKSIQNVQTPGTVSQSNESFRSCNSNSILNTNYTIVNDDTVKNYVTIREEYQTPEKNDENEKNLKYEMLINKPVIKVNSPEPPMSPARYRSLDTLTSAIVQNELPEPGKLRRDSIEREPIPLMLHSSPDLTGRLSEPSSTSSPNNNIKFDYTAFMKIKMANELLDEVIQGMNEKEYFEDISKIRESCESISSVGSKFSKSTKLPKIKSKFCSSPNLTKTSVFSKAKPDISKLVIKPQSRRPVRANSTSSVSLVQGRPSIRSSSVSDNKYLEGYKETRKLDSSKEAKFKPLPPIKNLYCNIKSTIPKPTKKSDKK